LRKLKVGGLILGDQGAVAVVQCFVALLLFSFEGRSLLRIARICKRLRSLGIDSASLRSLAGLYNIRYGTIVSGRQATQTGGIDY
jgi:hypothetical protein